MFVFHIRYYIKCCLFHLSDLGLSFLQVMSSSSAPTNIVYLPWCPCCHCSWQCFNAYRRTWATYPKNMRLSIIELIRTITSYCCPECWCHGQRGYSNVAGSVAASGGKSCTHRLASTTLILWFTDSKHWYTQFRPYALSKRKAVLSLMLQLQEVHGRKQVKRSERDGCIMRLQRQCNCINPLTVKSKVGSTSTFNFKSL